MSRRRKPEQIINLLREAEVALSQGETIGQVCRRLRLRRTRKRVQGRFPGRIEGHQSAPSVRAAVTFSTLSATA